jgi:hypothetical protein
VNRKNAQILLGELQYYSSQLNAIGEALTDLIRAKQKYHDFTTQVAETYRLLTLDLADVYYTLKRSFHRAGHALGGSESNVPLEFLENVFITLRDAAEQADSRAEKVSGFTARAARMSRKAADHVISLAENAAKILVTEAHKTGRWTIEWERELGLRRWLR